MCKFDVQQLQVDIKNMHLNQVHIHFVNFSLCSLIGAFFKIKALTAKLLVHRTSNSVEDVNDQKWRYQTSIRINDIWDTTHTQLFFEKQFKVFLGSLFFWSR